MIASDPTLAVCFLTLYDVALLKGFHALGVTWEACQLELKRIRGSGVATTLHSMTSTDTSECSEFREIPADKTPEAVICLVKTALTLIDAAR